MLDSASTEELTALAMSEGPTVVYHIATPMAVPSRTEEQVLEVARIELTPDFYYKSVPLLTSHVYRLADIVNKSSYVLLPGDATMYMGSDFVGQMNLPLIAIGLGIVVWLFLTRRGREAVLVILVLAAVTAGSEAVKELVARPRPPGFDTSIPGVVYSYPSGHVLEVLTILGIIATLLWRSSLPRPVRIAVPILFALIVVMVAVARVAVNAHYPSDVLAGFLGGLGCLGLFGRLSQVVVDRRSAESRAAA